MITADPFPAGLVHVPGRGFIPCTWCRVCGGAIPPVPGIKPEDHRCYQHQDRNPCLVEGCRRSGPVPEDGKLALDQLICGTHWRLYVPARSLLRRTYNAHFRRAKRKGWTHKSVAQFERFWDSLVKTVRRRSEAGHVDVAAIHRLFGWDEPEG